MNNFKILEPEKVLEILNVFHELDNARWSDVNCYDMINYCNDDLTSDEKLLTHWLCYITDRQMPFERIWDIGGYVISSIVYDYTNSGRDVWEIMLDHIEVVNSKNGNKKYP